MKAFTVKNQSFYYKMRKYVKEYGKISNIHGIHYLTEQRTKIEKYFWITILLLALFGSIFMINQIWTKYEESPIVITFASKQTPIHEIPYPAVTICPESKFSSEKFNYTDVYNRIRHNESVSAKEIHQFSYLYILCDKNDGDDYNILSNNKSFVEDDFFDIIDELKPNFSTDCYLLGVHFNCYFVPIVTDQGICYTFNILDRSEMFREEVIHFKNLQRSNYSSFNDDEYGYINTSILDTYPLRAFLSGVDNALDIYLTHYPFDNNYLCNVMSKATKVLIHSPLDIPRLEKNYFLLTPEKHIMVAVEPDLITTADRVKTFDPDIKGCYSSNERYLKYFRVYTQSNCLMECITNFTLNKCGCVDFFMPRENGTRICSGKWTYCLETAERDMMLIELERKIMGLNPAPCDCQPSCNILKYNVDISQSEYLEEADYESNERLSHLMIYFKNDQFMTMERKEIYGTTDFISNFGGILGLFTGFSLISLFEIIYFLTLRIFCNNRIHNSWGDTLC